MSHYGPTSSSVEALSVPTSDLNQQPNTASDNEEDYEEDNVGLFDFEQDVIVDPLDAVIDQLEDRLITLLDDFKIAHQAKPDDLQLLLRPALELGAHIAPSTARTNASSRSDVDEAVSEVYTRLNLNLLFPVLLEVAQSDTTPAKRAAALQFFHNFHKECQLPGSYLDRTPSTSSGPTGDGRSVLPTEPSPLQLQQRSQLKHSREVELLHHWIDAATDNTATQGIFTSRASDESIASRGMLSANAALRPAFRCIAQSIAAADDTGAMNLYVPVVNMTLGILSRLFLDHHQDVGDSVRASCLKFLETVVLICTSKGPRQAQRQRKVGLGTSQEDFCLEDIPAGHPTITREVLDSIGEFAFTALR